MVKGYQYVVRGNQNFLLRPCCSDNPALIFSSIMIIIDQFDWWPNAAADAAPLAHCQGLSFSLCSDVMDVSVVLLLTVSSSGMQESAGQSGDTSAVTSPQPRERERERERTGASSLPIH